MNIGDRLDTAAILAEEAGKIALRWFRTHPPTGERIARIVALAPWRSSLAG